MILEINKRDLFVCVIILVGILVACYSFGYITGRTEEAAKGNHVLRQAAKCL